MCGRSSLRPVFLERLNFAASSDCSSRPHSCSRSSDLHACPGAASRSSDFLCRLLTDFESDFVRRRSRTRDCLCGARGGHGCSGIAARSARVDSRSLGPHRVRRQGDETAAYIAVMDSDLTLALRAVPDDELLRRLGELVSQSRRVEADLVAHIGEVDERRLFARQAFPSMFAYCTECLHLSEAEAYRRITVARAARQHPDVLEALRDGRLHLSGLARLVPLLTADNCTALLQRASHLTTRQIEQCSSRSWRPGRTSPPESGSSRRSDKALRSSRSRRCLSLRPPNPSRDESRRRPPIRTPRTRRATSCRRAGSDSTGRPDCPPAVPDSLRRTAGASPLQGPVHRQRGAARQARAADGAPALGAP